MDKRKKRIVLLCLLLHIIVSSEIYAAISVDETTITTPEIIASGVSGINPSCLNWCFTGTCVWLRCTWFGCSIRTTPRYKHNNPDLVVTVYDELGEDPWVEMNAWYSTIQILSAETILRILTPIRHIGGGHQKEGSFNVDESLRFKEASAYGHPMTTLSAFVGGYALCPSEARPFFPYYLSGVDAAEWRFGLVEMTYLPWLLPGMRTVGRGGFFQQWGAVFPRTGFIKQKDDPKAGAVVAQRVGNIITGHKGAHLAASLRGRTGFSKTWLPGELIENDRSTGVWQMIKPKSESICYTFGENDVFSALPWSFGRTSDDNSYVYALWRNYECCRDRGRLIDIIPAMICM